MTLLILAILLMLYIGDITYNDISYKINEFNITHVLSTVISGVIYMENQFYVKSL
jgi:hypothetical protein